MEQNVNSDVPNTIKFYFSVCVFPIGILLNAISIQFLKNTLNKSTNMGLLYGCLSCLNVIALVNVLIFNTLDFYEYDYESNQFTCKLVNVWTKVVLQLPSFQQVIIAFYLWLSICHPNKFKDSTKKIAEKIIVK